MGKALVHFDVWFAFFFGTLTIHDWTRHAKTPPMYHHFFILWSLWMVNKIPLYQTPWLHRTWQERIKSLLKARKTWTFQSKCERRSCTIISRRDALLLLQEKHFPSSYKPKFLHKRYPQFNFVNAADKERRATIGFSRSASFSPAKIIWDPEGHYILVQGTLDDRTVTFIFYYAPNLGQLPFFCLLFFFFQILHKYQRGCIHVRSKSE